GVDLPFAPPFLHAIFKIARLGEQHEGLIPDEADNTIFRREAASDSGPMIGHARNQVERGAEIKRPMLAACEHVRRGEAALINAHYRFVAQRRASNTPPTPVSMHSMEPGAPEHSRCENKAANACVYGPRTWPSANPGM